MFFVSLCQARLGLGSACQQTESHYQSMWLRLRCTASRLAFLKQICTQLMWAWRVSLFLVNLQHSDCVFHSSAIIVLDQVQQRKVKGRAGTVRHTESHYRGDIFLALRVAYQEAISQVNSDKIPVLSWFWKLRCECSGFSGWKNKTKHKIRHFLFLQIDFRGFSSPSSIHQVTVIYNEPFKIHSCCPS